MTIHIGPRRALLTPRGLRNPIPGLSPAAYYDFGIASSVAVTGAGVSQANDLSGNARHLLQGTDTNRPSYSGGVITFDGVDNYLKTSAFTFSQPETIYIVFNPISYTANDAVFDGNARDSGRFIQTVTTPEYRIVAAASLLQLANGPAVGSYGVYCVVINGASTSGRLNNGAKVSGTTGAGNMGGFTLGARGDGAGEWSNIGVKEVALFPAAHSDPEQDSIISYLMSKHGIA